MNQREQLAMRKEYLKKIIKEKTKVIAKPFNEKGSIRAVKRGKGFQYYLRYNMEANNGIYLPKSERKKAVKIVQHEYDEKVLTTATKELQLLEKIEKFYCRGCVEEIYEKMPLGKQRLVQPVCETQEQFLNYYLNLEYEKKRFGVEAPEYYSNKGERVRSKSEIIIANLLDTMKIPYRYEMPLKFTDQITVHPDFTLIDSKNRRLIYWEHLGMLDDEEYLNMAIAKIRKYEEHGYLLGQQLFITAETLAKPLDVQHVKNKLQYILEK